jgi:hypothetical protein
MRGQDLVAGAVALVGLRGVERMTVDLDDEAGLRPEEIDLVAVDAGVDPRLGQLRSPDESEEAPLRLGPDERWPEVRLE